MRSGISSAILRWLLFCRSLNSAHWRAQIQDRLQDVDVAQTSDSELVEHWLASSVTPVSEKMRLGWLFAVIGALLGTTAMWGLLVYSGNTPINLWLILVMFALLPCCTAMLALFSWTRLSQHQPPLLYSAGIHILCKYGARFLPAMSTTHKNSQIKDSHQSLINSDVNHDMKSHDWLASRLFYRWFMWKFQWLALAFQGAAMATFMVKITLTGMAFGWSSTTITANETVVNLFQFVSLPWQWFIDAPSAALIQKSQFFPGQALQYAEQSRAWWSYVLMAMLTYGLLPRLVLVGWMRWRLKPLLVKEMATSHQLSRFLLAARQVVSQTETEFDSEFDSVLTTATEGDSNHQAHLSHSKYLQAEYSQPNHSPQQDNGQVHSNLLAESRAELRSFIAELNLQTSQVVIWQSQSIVLPDTPVMGVGRWQDDVSLVTHLSASIIHVCLIVQVHQTPTAELSDLVALIRQPQAARSISLLMVIPEMLDEIKQTELNQGQIQSWQYFCRQNNIDLTQVSDSLTGETNTATRT